jgi:hypothetical protein
MTDRRDRNWQRVPRQGPVVSHWVGVTETLKELSIWQEPARDGRQNSKHAFVRGSRGQHWGPFETVAEAKDYAEILRNAASLTDEERWRAERFEAVDKHMLAAGFEIVPTGGGCTAWQYTLPDGRYFWITDEGGTGLGFQNDQVYLVGFYTEDGENSVTSEHQSLDEALRVFTTLRSAA